ncbi:hypothetical protein [Collimonas humicola]|uniref:hypothetical protein n=1 Tax=Collimonas humicola TaxID=2825886 RepID=UPI001B8CAF43|nr:hypothetical protein [Collimonas humicola]
MRENFPELTKRTLGLRVGYKCSNPTCQKPTSGPHLQAERHINIGVAAHITAAASGGPRYASNMSVEQRRSASNGIWLCQVCAKLIDSDIDSFPVAILEGWKKQAEEAARHGISGTSQPITGNWHVPVPVLSDFSYHEARARLIGQGWQPLLNYPVNENPDHRYGNADAFLSLGYHELVNASPTGFAFCLFKFRDLYRNILHVVTAGEEHVQEGIHAGVISWWIERSEESPIPSARRPAIKDEHAPHNLFSHITPGVSQEYVRGVLGPPHRVYATTWSYRFVDALVQIEFRDGGGAKSVATGLTIDSPSSGFDVPMLGKPLGMLSMKDAVEEQGELEYRSSLRTEEIICQTLIGPTGVWKYYTFGALWPLAPGCLAESSFTWNHEQGKLDCEQNDVRVNWLAISDSADEIWFDWGLAH